ncbi:MAG: YtxH domain-containing protein [Prevotellaceae bacterium]|nr:YtxH domain-containing protein [Prevotellaceae bacterium]
MKNGLGLAAAFLGGAVVGATVGLLFAPEKGVDQRRKIAEKLRKYGVKLGRKELNELVDELEDVADELAE